MNNEFKINSEELVKTLIEKYGSNFNEVKADLYRNLSAGLHTIAAVQLEDDWDVTPAYNALTDLLQIYEAMFTPPTVSNKNE